MSFWTRLGVSITDLECFKKSCEKNEVDFIEEQGDRQMHGGKIKAMLKDRHSGSCFYLVADGGGYKVVADNDVNYNRLSGRLGTNGGRLTRDYAVNKTRKTMRKKGGNVRSCKEEKDGSVLLRIAV